MGLRRSSRKTHPLPNPPPSRGKGLKWADAVLLNREQGSRPQLLVSVRNVLEARAALAGGAEIMDLKEPAQGSLGMASPANLAAVAELVGSTVPLSAALGEMREWLHAPDVPPIPASICYLKLGLSKMAENPNWQHHWQVVRQRFETAAGKAFAWIAVVYADWQSAGAPPPMEVVTAALTTDCAGLLIDTYDKSGRTLLDEIGGDELRRLTDRVQDHGLLVAFAGSLRREHVEVLRGLHPDILAIRTAACRNQHRDQPIDAEAVRRFRSELNHRSEL